MGLFKPLYAIYPGTVSTRDEDGNYTGDITWSAADLAAVYGVADEPYLTITSQLQVPQGLDYFKYFHLMPRPDNKYQNVKYVVEDDGQVESWRPDFDATKQYTMETDQLNIYPDDKDEPNLHENADEV